jgi:hypothetical protein
LFDEDNIWIEFIGGGKIIYRDNKDNIEGLKKLISIKMR